MKAHHLLFLIIMFAFNSCFFIHNIDHSEFYDTHDALTQISALVENQGLQVSGHSGAIGSNSSGSKESTGTISGDYVNQQKIIGDYKNIIESDLKRFKLKIKGHSVTDTNSSLSGFTFHYENSSVRGLIRVKSFVLQNGNLQIDIFFFEYV